MSAPDPAIEHKALLLSAAGSLLIGCVGLTFAALSGSQAILLDGAFNLAYFVTGLVSLKVASLLRRCDDEHFPYGYAYFEPLLTGVKGVMVLGVSLIALFDAVTALLSGGRSIDPTKATGYGLFATVVCWILAALLQRASKRAGSAIVTIDAENWVVNAAVSSGVLVTFASIFLLRGSRFDHLVPYVDPALVALIVLVSIGIPIRSSWSSLMQMIGYTAGTEIRDRVRSIVGETLAEFPVEQIYVRVTQPGRTRMVLVHVVLSRGESVLDLARLDELRSETFRRLSEIHPNTILDIVPTTDARWIDSKVPLDRG